MFFLKKNRKVPKVKENVKKTETKTRVRFEFKVNDEISNLLWISNEVKKLPINPEHIYTQNINNEPSTIDIGLPIIECKSANKLDYFPNYMNLNSNQRYLYLAWLGDVTGQIDIGYVFLFYYGLERYLLSEKYESAINMIDFLRTHHKNNSFMIYSSNAILFSCFYNKRIDLFDKLQNEFQFSELYVFVKSIMTHYLSADDIIKSSYYVKLKNRNYINGYPKLFKEAVLEVLNQKYNSDFYYVSEESIVESPISDPFAFANISIRSIVEDIKIHDIFQNEIIAAQILSILKKSHEIVKENLVILRREKKAPEKHIEKIIHKEYIVGDEEFLKNEKLVLLNIENSKRRLDLHFSFMQASDFYYKYRSDDNMLLKAEEYAFKDISLFPELHHDFMQEMFAIPSLPLFNRLSIIYENTNRIEEAIAICNMAIKYVNNYEREKFIKKLEKLNKKNEIKHSLLIGERNNLN